jgi:hypothetical protein
MKKWLAVLVVFLLIFISSLYLLIPNEISIRQDLSLKANAKAFYRGLTDDAKWGAWLTGAKKPAADVKPHGFYFNGYQYSITDRKLNSIDIAISDGKASAMTSLNVISPEGDSIRLDWEGKLPVSSMPMKRIGDYFRSRKLQSDMKILLGKIGSFYSNQDNIYGHHIEESVVVDSILVSTYAMSKGYPSTGFIYGLIGQLKTYIASQSAKETGLPMLNVTTPDSISFLTRVAIPVDKKLRPSGNISYKWMLGGGNILITEVKGGPGAINKAFRQLENYVADHQRIAPAIPFQSLVTNRLQEQDSAKWITRIYYPVM